MIMVMITLNAKRQPRLWLLRAVFKMLRSEQEVALFVTVSQLQSRASHCRLCREAFHLHTPTLQPQASFAPTSLTRSEWQWPAQ